jgi:hypothetical protein
MIAFDEEIGECCVGDTQHNEVGQNAGLLTTINGAWEVLAFLACINLLLLHHDSAMSLELFFGLSSVLLPLSIVARSWVRPPAVLTQIKKEQRSRFWKWVALAGTVVFLIASRTIHHCIFKDRQGTTVTSSDDEFAGGKRFRYFGVEKEIEKASNISTVRYDNLFADSRRDSLDFQNLVEDDGETTEPTWTYSKMAVQGDTAADGEIAFWSYVVNSSREVSGRA